MSKIQDGVWTPFEIVISPYFSGKTDNVWTFSDNLPKFKIPRLTVTG